MRRVLVTCVLVLFIVCLVTPPILAALTKTTAFDTIDDWQAVAAATALVGNAEDVGSSYSTLLFIEVALTDTDAQAGCTVLVQVSYAADDWVTLSSFTGRVATSATTTIVGAVADSNTIIDLTDAATAHFDHPAAKWFIVDGTVANSETVITKSAATNALTLADDVVRAHATGLSVWSMVDEWVVAIPMGAAGVRTIINNTDADSGVHFRTYCSKVTGL